MTVYVVTSGEYSDYRITGIFSTREKADAYVKEGKRDRFEDLNDPDEYELDALVAFRVGPNWNAEINLDTGELSVRKGPYNHIRDPEACIVDKPFQDMTRRAWLLRVSSPISEEHAAKVAAEKRQEWLRTQGLAPARTP